MNAGLSNVFRVRLWREEDAGTFMVYRTVRYRCLALVEEYYVDRFYDMKRKDWSITGFYV